MNWNKIKQHWLFKLLFQLALAIFLINMLGVVGGVLGFLGVMLCLMIIMFLVNSFRNWEQVKEMFLFNWRWNKMVWRKIYIKLGLLKEEDVSIWDNIKKKWKKK